MLHRSARFAAVVVMLAGGLSAQAPDPPQAARGRELFFSTAKPVACGTCHAMAGQGTAVGPDLKMWARMAPRATAMAITATAAAKPVTVEAKEGAFPGIEASKDDKEVRYYDLGKQPPELRAFAVADAPKTKPSSAWKHPPGTEKYTPEQLADVIAFIRWAGARDKKTIAPEEVE